MMQTIISNKGSSIMNLYNLLKGNISQEEFLNYYNITITYENLPNRINGYVFQYKGIYNIMINNYLSHHKKQKTILHELAHIELDHLNNSKYYLSALNIECYKDDADDYLKFIIENFEDEVDNYVNYLSILLNTK